MDLRDTADEARFRSELREWLAENRPAAAADTPAARERGRPWMRSASGAADSTPPGTAA